MRIEHDSYIKGAYKGWTSRGTYELVNGSRWQQVNYRYQYRYMYRPRAKVLSDGGRYLLEVEGMGEPVEVRRARWCGRYLPQ
jgi:hypothetical protein